MPTPSTRASWRIDRLRLPKGLEGTDAGRVIMGRLAERPEKLWSDSGVQVPTAVLERELKVVLEATSKAGHLVQGLEHAEHILSNEAFGMKMADSRSDAERGVRVSRLLLLSNDGAERFYRGVERLALAHGERLLVVKLQVAASGLGEVLDAGHGVIRALLIAHKKSVSAALHALRSTEP